MRELIFVLAVIGVLLALTAIRYRKQIAGIIGVARMLNEAKSNVSASASKQREKQKSVQLIHCSKCGVWVPQSKANRRGDQYRCADCSS